MPNTGERQYSILLNVSIYAFQEEDSLVGKDVATILEGLQLKTHRHSLGCNKKENNAVINIKLVRLCSRYWPKRQPSSR